MNRRVHFDPVSAPRMPATPIRYGRDWKLIRAGAWPLVVLAVMAAALVWVVVL